MADCFVDCIMTNTGDATNFGTSNAGRWRIVGQWLVRRF